MTEGHILASSLQNYSIEESARAALEARQHNDDPIDVQPVGDRPQRDEYWGQSKGEGRKP